MPCIWPTTYKTQGGAFQFNYFLNLIESSFLISSILPLSLINRPPGPSRSFALLNWTHQFIIDDLHNRGSTTFQVKPNQACFFHQPECSVLGIATDSPLHAGLVGDLHGSRCPSLTVVPPKLPLVCNPPANQSHHGSWSRDRRSSLKPFHRQRTPDILIILPGFWCSFEYRRI